jgi:hypothetical protein
VYTTADGYTSITWTEHLLVCGGKLA